MDAPKNFLENPIIKVPYDIDMNLTENSLHRLIRICWIQIWAPIHLLNGLLVDHFEFSSLSYYFHFQLSPSIIELCMQCYLVFFLSQKLCKQASKKNPWISYMNW